MLQVVGKEELTAHFGLWQLLMLCIFTITPNNNLLCPADLYTGSTVLRHQLQDLHTCSCPVYVLDPTLQSGKKLPQWQPQSCHGLFLGLSTIH